MNLKGCGAVLFRQVLLLAASSCLSFVGASAQQNTNITQLIPPGSTWKFLSTEIPDPFWQTAEYNDSWWNIGIAQFGYGDGDEATLVRTGAPPHPITTYFRKSFVLPEAMTFANAHIRLLRDDGAVVYINGTRVLRDNMPDGEITPQTVAISSTDNENAFREYTIPVQQLLRAGNNVIAVEVHQANMMSSDMSFDLSLGVSTFFSEQDMAIISIRATQPNTSEPLPNALVAPGEFTVFRQDPLLQVPLYVNLEYSGSATTNDYEPLPRTVYFPAGTNAVSFLVLPRTDHLVEGTESVVAQIAGGSTVWDRTSPHRAYWQRMSNSVAEVLIRDADTNTNPLPVVSISVSDSQAHEEPLPSNIGMFRLRRSGPLDEYLTVFLRFEGTATLGEDVKSMPSSVRLMPGIAETNVWVSPINDDLPELTETVIAILTTNLGPATYTIDPLARRATVSVLDNDTTPSTLTITEPQNGETFQQGQPITISAVAVDPLGHISRVEFYDGTNRIGVSEIVFIQQPAPGTPIQHSIAWSNAAPGPHTLTAIARDSRQFDVRSAPVSIFVSRVSPEFPIVGVRTVNFPVPPNTNADFATRMFEFYRIGNTTEPLLIFFTKSGSATPGFDYHEFSNHIVFAPGTTTTNLPVFVIDDTIVEGTESVSVELQPPPPTIDYPYPTLYIIDATNHTANVAIFDNDRSTPTNVPPQVSITRPADGAVFAVGEQIHIGAQGSDPDGSISFIDLYINGQLAWRTNAPFLAHRWDDAPPGQHTLRAVAADNSGKTNASEIVHIRVGQDPNPERPAIALEVIDGVAMEPYSPTVEISDTASFRLLRVSGPTNEQLRISLSFAGTAGNGVDYERIGTLATLAPGQASTNIVFKPLYDPATETEETILLIVNSIDCEEGQTNSSFFSCYTVVGTNMQQAVLRPPPGTNRYPEIEITQPVDGAVFPVGAVIPIAAHASDPDGTIINIDLFIDWQRVWRTNSAALGFHWNNAPAGEHVLRAVATDNLGRTNSSLVRVLVRGTNEIAFVRRELPRGYTPGVPFTVTLIATPPIGTQAWAVEDGRPGGWPVSNISHGGVYDPATGKVKFGHFTDATRRVLTYTITPPPNSVNTFEFDGTASADGRSVPITGDRSVSPLASEFHPADLDRNRQIVLNEVTAYAAAWKRGTNWLSGPVPIPADYVTRAAFIWRNGEGYRFIATNPPPHCWVPTNAPRAFFAASSSTAERAIIADGNTRSITVSVAPAATAAAYTFEEKVPAGWIAANISHEGAFDPASGKIRWGLFMDADPRAFTYTLTTSSASTAGANVAGQLSFDGETIPVNGESSVSTDPSQALRIAASSSATHSGVSLTLSGPVGQVCALEASTDLTAWEPVADLYLPDGQLRFSDPSSGETAQRYYRLRAD
ncbi:MAG TPA: Ig-like domain-containing protein [Verrucomicrobiae bacterium]